MAPDVRYLFGDILTNEVIEEIPCSGVTVSDSMSGGEFRGTFYLDITGKRNEDLVSATIPGRTYVVVERNGVPIWGGINWSRTYQSQAKVMQIYAKTMDQYATKRIMDTDATFTATEQMNIFRQLFINMQADPNSIQFVVPGTFADINLIDYSVAGAELRTYKDAFDQLSGADNGFEWRINIVRDSGVYVWALQMGYPFIGQPLGDTSVVFEYPGNILNYWQNDTIGSGGTNIYGAGSGEGDAMVQVEIIHNDLLTGGFPRLDEVISLKDVTNIDRLESLMQVQADLVKAPQPVYTVQLKADRTPEFGDWVMGDYSKLVFKDPLHPGVGLTHDARILKWDYTPPSSTAVEEVQLTFEGEDAE